MGIISESIGQLWNDITGVSMSNKFNSAEAQKQRDWEEEMSNTAYQRGVKDMQAAGINPAIMAMGGASTPSGASASSSGNSSAFVAGLVNSAMRISSDALNLVKTRSNASNKQDDDSKLMNIIGMLLAKK